MRISIKNMVCNRCIMAVQGIFDALNIPLITVDLGDAETESALSEKELRILESHLKHAGFELLEDAAKKQIGKIKTLIILKIAGLDIPEDFVLSTFITEHFPKDYSSVSKLFSQNENVTLEQYFILQKIEKAKELLRYDEFSLTEISQKLGYRSVQHLSAQFKNISGFTPTAFKNLKSKSRTPLDKI